MYVCMYGLVKIKGFRIVRILVFPVTTFFFFFFAFFCRKIHCLTSEFHGKFHEKNRYPMNHEAMSAILVFQAKVTFEFTSLAMNFSRFA